MKRALSYDPRKLSPARFVSVRVEGRRGVTVSRHARKLMLSLPLELPHREEGIGAVAIFAFVAVLGEPSRFGAPRS